MYFISLAVKRHSLMSVFYTDVCLISADMTNQCQQTAQNSFYFDKTTGECLEFPTDTCGSNDNNFDSVESCRKRCAKHLTTLQTSAPVTGSFMVLCHSYKKNFEN